MVRCLPGWRMVLPGLTIPGSRSRRHSMCSAIKSLNECVVCTGTKTGLGLHSASHSCCCCCVLLNVRINAPVRHAPLRTSRTYLNSTVILKVCTSRMLRRAINFQGRSNHPNVGFHFSPNQAQTNHNTALIMAACVRVLSVSLPVQHTARFPQPACLPGFLAFPLLTRAAGTVAAVGL